MLAVQLCGFAFIVAGTHGWIVPLTKPTTTDFVSFYSAGLLADAGRPGWAYDPAAHLVAEESVVGAGIEYQFFNYPPTYLLLCAALPALPYLAAFILFETATLLLYLFAATRVLEDRGFATVAACLAVPVLFWNYGLGQNAFLTAGLFGLGTYWLERRPLLAGLMFGLLCYKPQFGLLLPLALVAGGYWRVFIATTITVVVLIAASLLLYGAETWRAFIVTAGAAPAMYASGRILFAGMANPFGAVRLLGGSVPLAYATQVIFFGIAAVIVIATWRAPVGSATRAAVLIAAAPVAAPLSLLYDLMLTAVAAAWLMQGRALPMARGWEGVVLAGIYVVLADGRGIAEGLHLPVFPLAALSVLALAAARAWRESRIEALAQAA